MTGVVAEYACDNNDYHRADESSLQSKNRKYEYKPSDHSVDKRKNGHLRRKFISFLYIGHYNLNYLRICMKKRSLFLLEFDAHLDKERDLMEDGFLKLVDPFFEDH